MSQSSTVTKRRFRFLHFLVYIFYFVAALCAVVGVAAALAYYELSQLGRYDFVQESWTGAPPDILGVIGCIIVGILLALLMAGLAQFISLQLANEENTRKTTELLTRLTTRRQP